MSFSATFGGPSNFFYSRVTAFHGNQNAGIIFFCNCVLDEPDCAFVFRINIFKVEFEVTSTFEKISY